MENRLMHWEQLDLFHSQDSDNELEIDDDEDTYSEDEGAKYRGVMNIMPKFNKLVQTPLGPFVLDDTFHPMRGLDVFVAHVNFPILKSTLQTLNQIMGIEILKQIGRYRLLFVFGAMFDTMEVISNIEQALKVTSIQEDTSELDNVFIKEIQKLVDGKDKWLAYVFPNGEYLLDTPTKKSVYDTRLTDYNSLQKISKGKIYTSENEDDV